MKSKTEGKKSFLFSRKVGIFGTNCIFFFCLGVTPDTWTRTPTLCAVKPVLPGISAMSVLPRLGGGAMSSVSMDFWTGATLVQRLVPEFLCCMLFNTACLSLNIIRLLFECSTLKNQNCWSRSGNYAFLLSFGTSAKHLPSCPTWCSNDPRLCYIKSIRT